MIIWEFMAADHARAEFERIYGQAGEWARLMRRGAGYLGTELLADPASDARYLTIDRWESRDAYAAFRRACAADYEALDARCADLTREERAIGVFNVVDEGGRLLAEADPER